MKISFIGTGNVASNLGRLFADAGHDVLFGSRRPSLTEVSVGDAIEKSRIICLATPFSAVLDICKDHGKELRDKIVVDITNPINIEDWSPLDLGSSSAAEEISILLPGSKVVKAFNTIFADVMTVSRLQFNGVPLTAFIASDDEEAIDMVKGLAEDAGFSGLAVGGLKNARYLEAMAHLNISIALAGGGTDAGFTYLKRNST